MNSLSKILKSLGFSVCLAFLASGEASAFPRSMRMFDPVMDEIVVERGNLAWAAFRHGALDALGWKAVPDLKEADAVREEYFLQKLDPRQPSDPRTFRQRYYVFSGHAAGPDAPVVLYIGGEAELLPKTFMGRFPEKLAVALQAHIVAVEHRYYGASQPFERLTSENLAYLSTDNAIADLVRFQGHAMKELGLRGKWIAVGGSYPGSLSAYYRLMHPELVVGALASSAPVQARNAFEEYDSHVTQVLGPACSEALREVNRAGEDALARGEFQSFKARFGAADVAHDVDFLYVLADITAFAVQYGSSKELCGAMVPAADRVSAYADHVREFLAQRGMTARDFSPEVALKLGAQESDGMRQWYYQSCAEYGYWQDAHRDPRRSVRSARINAAYDRELCQRFYGLERIADESVINSRYYEPLLDPARASRILFTNGSTDPWSELSITHERGNATNPATQAFMIEGASHCNDLRKAAVSDNPSLRRARELFTQLASGWVK